MGWIRSSFVSLLLIPVNSFAQQAGILWGTVFDEKTKEPLPLVSIFLANTLLGTSSSKNGTYSFNSIPYGKYDLTVSMVGYSLKTMPITLSGDSVHLDISLKQEIRLLKEVTIHSRPPHYQRLLSDFKRYFIGKTRNAERCFIQNLESINLEESDKTLIASCEEPIIIENRALGYRIHYILKEFKLDYRHGTCGFAGIARFEDLVPENKGQKRRWENERQRAYTGSLLHFLRSLKFHCLRDDEFEISLNCLNNEYPVSYTALFTENSDSVLTLKCPLKVAYHGEIPEENYPQPRTREFKPQISTLKLRDSKLIIYDNGYYQPQLKLEMDGYLGWSEKIAELIPLDYHLPGKQSK